MISDKLIVMIDMELTNARNKFSHFKNYHEGYAVLLEEFDELWEEIKKDQDKKMLLGEAVQVAAMAIRFIEDLLLEG